MIIDQWSRTKEQGSGIEDQGFGDLRTGKASHCVGHFSQISVKQERVSTSVSVILDPWTLVPDP